MLRSVRHIATAIVVIAVVILQETGIRIAVCCSQVEILHRPPIDRCLNTITTCASGICHHSTRALTCRKNGQLLIAAVDIEQRHIGRKFRRRSVARSKFIIPTMFGFVARSLGRIVARTRLVEIDTQILHHIGHHSILENIREDLRIESTRLVTL